MARPLLFAIPYSPWSLKARWALDHAGIDYRIMDFVPMVSIPHVFVRAGFPRQRITIPCLIDNGEVVMDSFAIAQYCNGRGRRPALIPAPFEIEIEAWNAHADRALRASRALLTAHIARDRKALQASVPAIFQRPAFLAGILGKVGVQYLALKYDFSLSELEAHEATLRTELETLRDALKERDSDYLCGDTLTYADITAASPLFFVDAPADHPVPAPVRSHWTQPKLAAEFADLVGWRDRIFSHWKEAPSAR